MILWEYLFYYKREREREVYNRVICVFYKNLNSQTHHVSNLCI